MGSKTSHINFSHEILFAVLIFACSLFFLINTAKAETEVSYTNKKDLNFVILRPDTDHPFWELFEKVMKSTCKDLGCHVDVKYANWDHFKMVEQAEDLQKSAVKPDFVFFQSYKNNGTSIIKALDAAGINGFLINAGLTPDQSEEMGKPREIYKHWVGQMLPDDFSAGKETAEWLYAAAKKHGYANENGVISIVGIEGNSADGASIERLRGLHSVIKDHDDLELLQVVQGKWDEKLSQKLATSLLKRYPDLHVMWAAGDPIALGIIEAAKEMGKEKDILTAGVDWAPRALTEIEQGTMIGSAGGHFMEGAWAAIIAYDYINGIDFAQTMGLELKSKMGFLSKDNLKSYRTKFGNGDFDSVDFTKFSRVYNPDNKDYNFDFSVLLN